MEGKEETTPLNGDAEEVLRAIPLLNGMVDVAIVFGVDESCSRELTVPLEELEEDEGFESSVNLAVQRELKLHFLQIVTPGQAYPEKGPAASSKGSRENLYSPGGEDAIPSGGHKKNFNVEEFGLSWETIETMHFFIFPEGKHTPVQSQSSIPSLSSLTMGPEGPHIYSNPDDLMPSVIPMLFTNILGERSFASVLRFTRPFFISQSEGCRHYSLTPWSPLHIPTQNSRLVYLPTCLMLVSKNPCFQFMKDALSGFHSNLIGEGEDKNFWDVVKMFCERIFLIPAPPPGFLSVEFQLPGFQSNLVVRPPRGDQYLDIRFNYPFMCLSVDNVLQVVSALLTGQTILFTSSLYPMLTYVIQSFLSYISPFVWRHAVVPILPYPLLEILDAPVATIIGIHSSLTSEPEFTRLENSVIVDLDNDTVTVKLQDGAKLPPLPKAAMDNFKTKYSMLLKQAYEIEAVQRLSATSSVAELAERDNFERNMDDALAKLFLELMVRLFRKVIKQLLQSRIKYEEAVQAMDPADRDFYRQTESTDMFTAFYQSQRQGKQSDFNLLAIRLDREERRQNNDVEDTIRPRASLLHTGSFPTGTWPSRKPSLISIREGFDESIRSFSSAMSISTGSSVEPVKMELPALGSEFGGREEFLDEVIETLNELQTNKAVEAQCVYLRGYYLLCKREVVRALEDFFDNLRRLEVTLVPAVRSLQGVLAFLSPREKATLRQNSIYNSIRSNRRATFVRQTSIALDLDKTMPKKPINHADFLKLVHRNAIATDADSASNLHIVLSQERTTVIAPETFKTFYRAWKEVLDENKHVELPNIELGKAEKGQRISEQVLAVAHYVRTNYGSQSTLVLTTYRLIAVTGFSSNVMADFSYPIRFENFSYATSFIGAKNPGIRIEMLDKQRTEKKKPQDLYMSFQDNVDRDNWYHMLVEMRRGWELSQRVKDPCVMETAQSHVVLHNAITQSGLMDRFNHQQRKKKAMKLLSFQSKDISEVSHATVDALQYRINPCLHETDRQTVESLLYIPPFFGDEEGQGKLWIGLGNGRLKVYDIESKCFESDIKITESKRGRSVRLSCLLLVNQHVWVGSFSKNIHILDAETVCHVSQLSYLEDAPRDMALSQDCQIVWSLLLNGCVVAWDPISRKRISKMQVPITDGSQYTTCTCFTIWRDHIWVGTNRGSISVMDSQTGTRITEVFFPGNSKKQVEIKHLAVSMEDEVWCSVYSTPRTEDSIFIVVFNPHTHEKKMTYNKLDNRVSIILPVSDSMWCGTKSGKIYIFSAKSYAEGEGMPKILQAHEDFIRTMTLTDSGLVVSGSGSNDGYAAVWKTIGII